MAEIEALHLHLVMTNMGIACSLAGKAECWTVVLMISILIWKEMRKVKVEAETQ